MITTSKTSIPLDLSRLRLDGGTQPRTEIDQNVVDTYTDDLKDGARFPPVTVFKDGNRYWLADGFHRYYAHIGAGKKTIDADVRAGGQRQAILHSLGANAAHGLQRSNIDKRRAVLTLLSDAEWGNKPENWIAQTCKVSRSLVRSVISDNPHLVEKQDRSKQRTVVRGGQTYQMDTSGIGKSADPEAQDAGMVEAAAKAAREAEQAEFDRQRDEARAALPEAIKQQQQAKADAIARREAEPTGLSPEQRIEELEEAVRVLEAENAELRAEVAKFGPLKVQFEQGGFEKILADKDELIRVAEARKFDESASAADWRKQAKFWKAEAIKRGWTSIETIDIGEVAGG